MSERIQQLRTLHELPWSELEGTRLRVMHSTRDHAIDPTQLREREGTIVGRSDGEGLHYDSKHHKTVATRIGPRLYLETPEDTILEVCTDNPENELLSWEGNSDDE